MSVDSVSPTVAGARFDAGPASVSLRASINEVVAFTFSLEPADRPVRRADLRITPLVSERSQIDPAALTIYRMRRVPVPRWRGWHIRSIPPDRRVDAPYDALVPWRAPRGGLPAILLPAQDYRFWVDVAVPKGTAPGRYRGRVALTDDDQDIGGVDIALVVSAVVLPDDDSIPVVVGVDHRALIRHHVRSRGQAYVPPNDDWRGDPARDEINALLQGTMRMLRAHRLTPVLPDLAPLARIDARGALELDWSAYDTVVAPFVEGHAFSDRLPLATWPIPTRLLGRGTKANESRRGQDEALARSYLKACAQHFRARGWLQRAYLSADPPGASLVDALGSVKRFATLARQVDPALPILTRLFPQDLSPYGWPAFPRVDLHDVIDVWAPSAQFFDAASLRTEREHGHRIWMSVDRPPFSGTIEIGAPSGCVLGLPWQARKLGADALLLAAVNRWPADTAVDPASCVAFDAGVLVYPGTAFGLSRPIPSVRLKLLRRAMFDAAYRRVLDERGDGHIGAALEESLVAYAGAEAYRAHFADGRPIGFALEATAYAAARRIMADRLPSGSSVARPSSSGSTVVRDATWRRFMLDTRRVELLVDGCRVRGALSSEPDGLDVDCWVSIFNGTRVPLEGQLKWAGLPDGWTTTARTWDVPSVAPNDVRRFLMSATAATFDARTGRIPLSVVLATNDGHMRRFTARACLAVAARTQRRIVVDGDLSDWRPGRTNVVSNFRLISATPANESAGAVVYPLLRTVAFLARDRDALYVGINSTIRTDTSLTFSGGNTLRYDDMVPVGEELVELLFDPLNAGTRSPTDLYHIALKPSGVHRAERGLAFDPPCGRRVPWSADAEVASRVDGDRWTAELRIPLSAFGARSAEGTVWGFNVTRFDATGQQFSTWSGASGNAYDPLALGNLYIPGDDDP